MLKSVSYLCESYWTVCYVLIPVPISRHHLSYDACLQDKSKNYQTCAVYDSCAP